MLSEWKYLSGFFNFFIISFKAIALKKNFENESMQFYDAIAYQYFYLLFDDK